MSDQAEKKCYNCRHVDPADQMLCLHPTRECQGLMWSAFQFIGDEPTCFDDDVYEPVGWRPQP